MTYLVGYGPHKNDRSAVELACQLARTSPQPVVAVSVVPLGWGTPVAGDTDREFQLWAAQEGESSSAAAVKDLALHPDVESSAVWVSGRSVPQTLLDQAELLGASFVVVGSGSDTPSGQISLTSKTDRLAHSSTVPVAIAPRNFRSTGAVTRLTVAFRDDDLSWSLLTRVAALTKETSVRLRLVTFLVRPPRRPATNTVSHSETQVLDLWNDRAQAAQAEAKDELTAMGFNSEDLELRLVEGDDWGTAIKTLNWAEGDVLVVGSSSTHRLAQVFLGSSASKIVRHSPVPVVIFPGTKPSGQQK